MGSITQSPDRIAQVLSGSAIQHGAGGDSAVQPADSNPHLVVEQAAPGVNQAEFVYESRQQFPSVSEGVASAGAPPHLATDDMDEFVPAPGVEPPHSGVGWFEGETSGGADADPADGSNGYGEMAAAAATGIPVSPMDYQPEGYQATNASAPLHLAPPNGHASAKRKSCSQGADFLEAKRTEGAGLSRVPSDVAMLLGLSDGEGGDARGGGGGRLPVYPADSTVAGMIAPMAEGEGAETAQGAPAAGTTAPHPTDADIIAWENQIREEEVRNVPLVGDKEPLQALEAEYAAGSDVFVAKIRALRRQGYASIRRARGDGNCFFRSFLFAYLEGMVVGGDTAERDRAVLRLTAIKHRLLAAGYDELVLESPLELLLGMLRAVGSPSDPLTLPALEGNMRSDDVSNYAVFLLRMATSAEIKRRAEFFAPFVLGLADMDVDAFCRKCIDPMGEESDHVHLVALTDALQVPVRVVYLDRSMALAGGGSGGEPSGGPAGGSTGGGTALSAAVGAGVKVDAHDFVPDAYKGAPEPRVHLLYRPGHYDILYLG